MPARTAAPESPSPVERARALQPLIREAADEAERATRLPNHVAMAMADAGLYRLAAPAAVGGGEATPTMQVEVIEAVSEADGAAGWNIMIGIEAGGIAGASLRREVATEIFRDPRLIIAGALNPLGKARPEPGGLRVTGQWPFASGCHNAQFFHGQCIVYDGDVPARNADGQVVVREVLAPLGDYTILDTWHVSGLRGSGSHDVAINDLFVPDRFVTNISGGELYTATTLYHMPLIARLSYNKTGVALGVARAAISHFIALANDKRPRLSRSLLRERGMAQVAVAEAEATLRSGRAFLIEALADVWSAMEAGGSVSMQERTLLLLACTHAVASSVRAVELVHAAAGTSANVAGHPLERCFRDVHVVPQHITVSPQWYESTGRVLLGLESGSPLL